MAYDLTVPGISNSTFFWEITGILSPNFKEFFLAVGQKNAVWSEVIFTHYKEYTLSLVFPNKILMMQFALFAIFNSIKSLLPMSHDME